MLFRTNSVRQLVSIQIVYYSNKTEFDSCRRPYNHMPLLSFFDRQQTSVGPTSIVTATSESFECPRKIL